jgi:hypothetical protein
MKLPPNPSSTSIAKLIIGEPPFPGIGVPNVTFILDDEDSVGSSKGTSVGFNGTDAKIA